MPHCPTTKQFSLAPCTIKCRLVSENVARANIQLFICISVNKISNFEAAMNIQFFHFLILLTAKIFAFSYSISKILNFYMSGKNFGKLTVTKTPTVPHISLQFSCKPKNLLCGFVIFWEDKMSIVQHSDQHMLPNPS